MVVAIAVIVIAVFVVAMWLMYDRPADDFEKPIEVLAEFGPIKVKPEETGGKEILDQDKDVYKRLTGDGDQKQPTSLAQEAEIPLSNLPDDEGEQMAQTTSEEIVIVEPVDTSTVQEKPVSAAKAVPATKVVPAAIIEVGKHKVQLGAYSTQDGAKAFWKEIRAKMPSVFAGMHDEYVPLSSGGRTLYRLRAGPVENRAAADRLCLELKAKKHACMVVDPK